MKFELSEQVKNNILTFLDRVAFTSFKEVSAINEILQVLNNPIIEELPKS